MHMPVVVGPFSAIGNAANRLQRLILYQAKASETSRDVAGPQPIAGAADVALLQLSTSSFTFFFVLEAAV